MTGSQTRFLVASDSSRAALEAARCAIRLAESCGGLVRVMAVIHRDGDSDDATRGHEDEERALAYIAGLGMERGIEVEVQSVADRGRDPYEAILEAATEWEADFIFMGRTGRHGPGRALMGSQTEHVLEFSEVPVVVVPTHSVGHG